MKQATVKEFHVWLLDQKDKTNWSLFTEYLDNRISIEREMIMMHLGALSRENLSAVNSLVECRTRLELLEQIRDLPVTSMEDIVGSVNPS